VFTKFCRNFVSAPTARCKNNPLQCQYGAFRALGRRVIGSAFLARPPFQSKIIKQRCFKERGGGGEGDLLMVWIFSLSLKACTMKEIEGEELVYI
jgi:hypothetical protein